MIPLSLANTAQAQPGYLLVERVEQPVRRGRIQIPDSYRGRTRAVEAFIVSVGRGVSAFGEGERVLLAHASGDEIRFGVRGERSLWKVPPSTVLARIYGEDEISHEGVDPTTHLRDVVPDYDDPLWEEGDPRGLR